MTSPPFALADIETQLLPDERADLKHYEGIIERGLETFWQVGESMEQIRTGRLYREDYGTFETYCTERWGIGSSRARQIRGASAVRQQLESVTTVTVLPTNEAQARPLKALPDLEQRVEAWNRAVESAGGQQPTAAQVSEAVSAVKSTNGTAPVLFVPHPLPISRAPVDDEPTLLSAGPGRTCAERAAVLERALRAASMGGLFVLNGDLHCLFGCTPVYDTQARENRHAPGCPMGEALEMLAQEDAGGRSGESGGGEGDGGPQNFHNCGSFTDQ